MTSLTDAIGLGITAGVGIAVLNKVSKINKSTYPTMNRIRSRRKRRRK